MNKILYILVFACLFENIYANNTEQALVYGKLTAIKENSITVDITECLLGNINETQLDLEFTWGGSITRIMTNSDTPPADKWIGENELIKLAKYDNSFIIFPENILEAGARNYLIKDDINAEAIDKVLSKII
jgi:hypothetical protein